MNPNPAPSDSNVFAAAIGWMQGTLLGSVASIIAVVAVAWFGLLLLSGRLSRRRVVQLVMGCFILFGASSIAAGLMIVLDGPRGGAETVAPPLAPPPVIASERPATPTQPYDPYAGAAVPRRR